jgi:Mg-chelatase subunit ChlD
MTDAVLDQLFKNQTTKTGTIDDIILIVDRSGSMSDILSDAQGGINSFISDQRKVGEAYFTLVQFDYEIEPLHEQVELSSFNEEYELKPRGGTALLDAVGATCGGYEPKGNGKVIIAIVTDGEENSSSEWTRDALFEMITKKREEDKWEFMFLASGQDAIREGTRMGFAMGDNTSYNKRTYGATKSAYVHASANTTSLRTGGRKLDQADYEAILKDEQTK